MKTPLLLLHGALGCATQFDDLRRHLPGEFPIWAPDFPGHGQRPADDPFAIPAFAADVLNFLNEKQCPQARIFGYSMGGYVALYLAWKHPERVQQIITLGTKLDWTPETGAREAARLDPEKIAAKVPAFAQLLAERHSAAGWQEVLRNTASLLHDLGEHPPLGPEAFGAISCPVCIGLGSEDNMVTVEESQAVARQLPAGRFEVLEGVKHPFEQVEAVNLARWLGGKVKM